MAGQRLVGLVTRAGTMQKTVMVEVARTTRHPKYHKEMRRRTRLFAHDEAGVLTTGDKVRPVPVPRTGPSPLGRAPSKSPEPAPGEN